MIEKPMPPTPTSNLKKNNTKEYVIAGSILLIVIVASIVGVMAINNKTKQDSKNSTSITTTIPITDASGSSNLSGYHEITLTPNANSSDSTDATINQLDTELQNLDKQTTDLNNSLDTTPIDLNTN